MKTIIAKVVKISPHTAIVAVERRSVHPKYKKEIKKLSKFMVHDSIGVAVGDDVEVLSCAPISKRKRHTIKAKVSK